MKSPLFLTFLLTTILCVNTSLACDCKYVPINERYIVSDVVLTAEIGSFESVDQYYRVKISPNHKFKADAPEYFYLNKGLQNSSCNVNINSNEVWLLFLKHSDSTDRYYLTSCSGSKKLLTGELDVNFDSSSIYDTTVFSIKSPYYFDIDFKNGDSACIKSILDSCARILNIQNKMIFVTMTTFIDGHIEVSKHQTRELDPAIVVILNDFLKTQKCKPLTLFEQKVNVEFLVPIKKLPPTPR